MGMYIYRETEHPGETSSFIFLPTCTGEPNSSEGFVKPNSPEGFLKGLWLMQCMLLSTKQLQVT